MIWIFSFSLFTAYTASPSARIVYELRQALAAMVLRAWRAAPVKWTHVTMVAEFHVEPAWSDHHGPTWPIDSREARDLILGGGGRPVDAFDVEDLAAYQDELGVPRTLEWVHDTSPTLADAARAAGWKVDLCPLLALPDKAVVAPRDDLGVRMLEADDARLALALAAVSAGFGGVEPGPELPDVSRDRQRIEAGLTRVAGAFTDMGPEASGLGGGSHLPRGTAPELVGIAVIPSARRRGLRQAPPMPRGRNSCAAAARDRLHRRAHRSRSNGSFGAPHRS